MTKALELTGQRFGRLTVKKKVEEDNRHNINWLCQCDCGNITKVDGSALKRGVTQSCGCLHREIVSKIKHGHAKKGMQTKTYKIWRGMRSRCNNPKVTCYKYYGGRGITICDRWNDFRNFLADMGKRPKGMTIDRKNNNGDYEPGNCRWATYQEQSHSSRQTKLNPLKVQVIKKLLKESKLTQTDIGNIFGVWDTTISAIKTKRTWKDIIYNGL